MFTFFMALVIIVVLLTFIFILVKNGHDAPVRKNERKSAPPETVVLHEKDHFPNPAPEFNQSQMAISPSDELDLPDTSVDLKQHLRKGIDCIFDEGAVIRKDCAKPLSRQDIEPQLFEDVLGHISTLSHFRTEQIRLQKMLNDPSVQMTDLSKIILSDPVITAKILRMANSSYFGLRQKIDSISHALMLLGLLNVKSILYREGMRQLFQAESPLHQKAVAALWRHSSLTSVCAQHLYDLFDGLNRGTLFTLGIIHDIGKLIILELPQAKRLAIDFWGKYPDGILIREEDQLLGINHAVISGMALASWNFSELMSNVAGAHHLPPYMEAEKTGLNDEELKYTIVLFLADQMAGLITDWEEGIIRPYTLHPSYFALTDKKKLLHKILDTNFLAQIRETDRLAMDEKAQKTGIQPVPQAKTPPQFPAMPDSAHTSRTRTIGRYEIVREVGRGTMGIVYLARDPLIHREVAIKTLRYQTANEKEMAEAKSRFFKEAMVIGKLTHPNIITIHDVGDYPGGTFIAMEFLDGTDLLPFCNQQNRLPLPEIVRVMSCAALALDYAHQNHIIHRDIKPGNIRITKSKIIKVIDFGIAFIGETSGSKDGMILGSPHYMSPEHIAGQSLDGRSDLFSLGVILYELLTGKKPFRAEALPALFMQIQTEDPEPLKALAPDVPRKFIAIVEKCLAKEKERRFASGRELADALADCLR
jgi:HD-like signal output (HDOD) protein/tRNA A-37 threonylcarbamoyl transferase component Bud32